jgi:A/G-specific adenine glycosylase
LGAPRESRAMDPRIGRVRAALLGWYERNGRSHLPWRLRRSPYRTLVSEFMLAQTQAERVAAAFEPFVGRFDSFAALADASVADVLRAWQGLGYNSRAVRLRALAQIVMERYGGSLPAQAEALRALPGVGPYTAAAVRAFAFDLDDAPMDVNIRRVVQRTFFGLEYPKPAPRSEIEAVAHEAVPPRRSHDWNSALMDLGATICTARAPKCLICPLLADCVAAPVDAASFDLLRRQASKPAVPVPFERTVRFARGRIVDRLRELEAGTTISFLDLHGSLRALLPERDAGDVRAILAGLERDGLVTVSDERISLPEG